MLLVSVQNQKTKETKVSVVAPGSISRFLDENVPSGCVAFVQDCPVYLSPDYNLQEYLVEVAPDIYSEASDFKKKWCNHFKNDEK